MRKEKTMLRDNLAALVKSVQLWRTQRFGRSGFNALGKVNRAGKVLAYLGFNFRQHIFEWQEAEAGNLDLCLDYIAPGWRPVGLIGWRRNIPGKNRANFGQILKKAEPFRRVDGQRRVIFQRLGSRHIVNR